MLQATEDNLSIFSKPNCMSLDCEIKRKPMRTLRKHADFTQKAPDSLPGSQTWDFLLKGDSDNH